MFILLRTLVTCPAWLLYTQNLTDILLTEPRHPSENLDQVWYDILLIDLKDVEIHLVPAEKMFMCLIMPCSMLIFTLEMP